MSEDVEERLARLEERLAWLQRHVVEQDKAMLELAEAFERAQAELRRLREQGGAGPALFGGEERPPHY